MPVDLPMAEADAAAFERCRWLRVERKKAKIKIKDKKNKEG